MRIVKRLCSTIGVEGVLIGGTALINPEWLAEHAYWFIGVGVVGLIVAGLWDVIAKLFGKNLGDQNSTKPHISIGQIGTGRFEDNVVDSDATFLESHKVEKLTMLGNWFGRKGE